jgi:uncharacterized protein (TIGR03083 family)
VEHWESIRAQRLALADQLEGLTAEGWATPSLCDAWTVRDVAAHLIVPHVVSIPRFGRSLVGARGRFPAANVAMTTDVARQPTDVLLADLRRFAASHARPPIFDSSAPLTEILVHGQDIRVPLGLPAEPRVDLWTASLAFLVQPRARFGFVQTRLRGLRLVATDSGWAHGSGDEARGPAGALALTVLGRTVRAGELDGPGAAQLTARVGG